MKTARHIGGIIAVVGLACLGTAKGATDRYASGTTTSSWLDSCQRSVDYLADHVQVGFRWMSFDLSDDNRVPVDENSDGEIDADEPQNPKTPLICKIIIRTRGP